MNVAIVLTTIGVPSLLLEYAQNFLKYQHLDVGFIVIGDRLTPNAENQRLASQLRQLRFDAEYWDIESQDRWLKRFPGLGEVIPYDSDCRRNIGYLLAAERGANIIVSLDDDNFVGIDDFLGRHLIIDTVAERAMVSSPTGWWNPCSLLELNPQRPIYPRGFPYSRRWQDKAVWGRGQGRVVLNTGLWLEDPDLDAVAWLGERVTSVGIRSPEPVMLAPGTFCPINTQNTAFHRRVLPCFFYVVMGAKIDGLVLDRYGDIWGGLFAKKVIDLMGDRITLGHPLVHHRRHRHNLFRDLQKELWGMILTDYMVPWLESINLTETSYPGLYSELAQAMGSLTDPPHADARKYLGHLAHAMQIWVETCVHIL